LLQGPQVRRRRAGVPRRPRGASAPQRCPRRPRRGAAQSHRRLNMKLHALAFALLAGCTGAEPGSLSRAIDSAAFTTFDPVAGASLDSPDGAACTTYSSLAAVWFRAAPGLPDGDYVLQREAGDCDPVADRSFTVAAGAIVAYAGARPAAQTRIKM